MNFIYVTVKFISSASLCRKMRKMRVALVLRLKATVKNFSAGRALCCSLYLLRAVEGNCLTERDETSVNFSDVIILSICWNIYLNSLWNIIVMLWKWSHIYEGMIDSVICGSNILSIVFHYRHMLHCSL